jgi:hypothetical protein
MLFIILVDGEEFGVGTVDEIAALARDGYLPEGYTVVAA